MEPLFQSQTEYTFDEFKRYNREILYKVRKVNKTIIMLEVMFPDGNKLVTIQDPVRLEKREEAIPMDQLITMN